MLHVQFGTSPHDELGTLQIRFLIMKRLPTRCDSTALTNEDESSGDHEANQDTIPHGLL